MPLAAEVATEVGANAAGKRAAAAVCSFGQSLGQELTRIKVAAPSCRSHEESGTSSLESSLTEVRQLLREFPLPLACLRPPSRREPSVSLVPVM